MNPLHKLFSDPSNALGQLPVINKSGGITQPPSQLSVNAQPVPKSSFGGFPPNPVPDLNVVPQVQSKGLHLGWVVPSPGHLRRGLVTIVNPQGGPVPITIPRFFRTLPPMALGMSSAKLGGAVLRGVNNKPDLHESIGPSNPIPFTVKGAASNTVSQVTNAQPAVSNLVAQVTNLIKNVTGG